MTGAAAMLMGNSSSGGGGGGGGGTLTVTIPAGQSFITSAAPGHTYLSHSFTATGGTGPYTGIWSNTNDGFGTWNGPATGASFTPIVSNVAPGDGSTATYVVNVTDSLGVVGTSNIAVYNFQNISRQ